LFLLPWRGCIVPLEFARTSGEAILGHNDTFQKFAYIFLDQEFQKESASESNERKISECKIRNPRQRRSNKKRKQKHEHALILAQEFWTIPAGYPQKSPPGFLVITLYHGDL
jgi:hypothetical protein